MCIRCLTVTECTSLCYHCHEGTYALAGTSSYALLTWLKISISAGTAAMDACQQAIGNLHQAFSNALSGAHK